jgi:hypothetical protein
MKEFDLDKLERKNIYAVPDNLFENIQEKVMNDVKATKKAPIFKLNWMYSAAASLALIFGATFVYNLNSDSAKEADSQTSYVANNQKTKTESQVAYETLKSDLTSVENNNQTSESQNNKKPVYVQDNHKTTADMKTQTVKPASKQEEAQMNEYLDSFTNSEISELASNSTQDVYLDLYN